MKTEIYDGADARRVLAAVITQDAVCGPVAAVWPPGGLFGIGWANLAAGLAVRHFLRYGRAPNGRFTALFEEWANTTETDEKTIKHIERFLQTVSDDAAGEAADVEYMLDLAERYFSKVVWEREKEAAEAEVRQGKLAEAQARMRAAGLVSLRPAAYSEPGRDIELWIRDDDTVRKRPLVFYRGDLGDFIGDVMVRKTLFAFLAPDKVGKTTWLVDAVARAIRNRCRVAYFELGDGDETEFMARLGPRLTGQPPRAGVYALPVGWNGNEPELTDTQLREYDRVAGFKLFRKLAGSLGALRVQCYPNSSASIHDLDATLAEWARYGWKPDVVVMDYADILAAPPGNKDRREQVDETWKAMKRMAQERDCLVLTASQSNAGAYGLGKHGLLGRGNFSESKGKNAHVDGILGINVTPDEKAAGAARINWVVRRKGEQNERDFCRVAGSFSIGNPAIVSRWGRYHKDDN